MAKPKQLSLSFFHSHSLPQFDAGLFSGCSIVFPCAQQIAQCPPWIPTTVHTSQLHRTWWRIWVSGRSAHSKALFLPQRFASQQTAARTVSRRCVPSSSRSSPSVSGTSGSAAAGWWFRCQRGPHSPQCQTPPATGSAGFPGCSSCDGPALRVPLCGSTRTRPCRIESNPGSAPGRWSAGGCSSCL